MTDTFNIDDGIVLIEPFTEDDSLYHSILNAIVPEYQNSEKKRVKLASQFKERLKQHLFVNNTKSKIMIEKLRDVCYRLNLHHNKNKQHNFNLIVDDYNLFGARIIIDGNEVDLFEKKDKLLEASNVFFMLDSKIFVNHLYFILSKYGIENNVGKPIRSVFDGLEAGTFNDFLFGCISEIIHVNMIVLNSANKIMFDNTEDFKSNNPFIVLKYETVFKTVGFVNSFGLSQQLFDVNSEHVANYITSLEVFESAVDDISESDPETESDSDSEESESDVDDELEPDYEPEFVELDHVTKTIIDEDKELDDVHEQELNIEYDKVDVPTANYSSEETSFKTVIPQTFQELSVKDLRTYFPGEKITLKTKDDFIKRLYERLIN